MKNNLIGDKTDHGLVRFCELGCVNTSLSFKMSRTREDIFDDIHKIDWDIHHTYGQSYLTYENQRRYDELISEGRRLRVFKGNEHFVLKSILSNAVKHLRELQEHLRNQPRRDAQKFIGKRNVRWWLFKRDSFLCLCCGDSENLSVDHIVPINRGGENKLSNLQTLCRSCNSRKSDSYIDFR
jgi:5-methylcytosine-specific restriction protein A